MEWGLFFKGLGVGFSIAAPVGPIGVLCIRRSLADGTLMGLSAGLGAATADALYGCVAGFGLTAVSNLLVSQSHLLALIGGAFLCYLGVRAFLAPPAQAADARSEGYISTYFSTLFLTIMNPATILSFIAVFAAFGLVGSKDYVAASQLVLGVFVGSAAWWLILSTGVGLLRARVTPVWMRAINRLSGILLFAFGVFAISRAFAR
jgi:threonine/homoserine/homoserine lactone efflux protein